ncbi:MAG: dimethyl sulfoxide reductase anchor subunit [Magnetococcales bacterium]|nr:dimethyl sulfoxide reductase anchor subunit [Magnetococcales bacterium]
MKPALSVVLLTTLIGVGQGMFLALFAGQTYAFFHGIKGDHSFYVNGSLVVMGFMAVGLIASIFHLGRPERGWMSARQWRTSWLSREVIVLPLFMGMTTLYGLAHYFNWTESFTYLWQILPVDLTAVIGGIGILVSLLLFLCTGMIYASVRFFPEWATPLTVINYTLMGTASGFTLCAVHSQYTQPDFTPFFAYWAAALTALALVMRLASLMRNSRLRQKIGLQQAIGIRHPDLRQNTRGFMAGSFNIKEFFHGHSPLFLKGAKRFFLLSGFLVPILLLVLGGFSGNESYLRLAFPLQMVGLMVERWFFFAQANHVQNLYYQAIA